MARSKDEKPVLSDDFHQVIDDIAELEFEDIPLPKSIKAVDLINKFKKVIRQYKQELTNN